MTLATFKNLAPLNERKQLKALRSAVKMFRSALDTYEWAEKAGDSLTHYSDAIESANKYMDEVRAKTRKVLNLSSFDLQELVNQFNFK